MSNEKKHFSFILFFGGVFTSFLVACGGDSGSNASSDDVNSSTSTIRSGTSTTPTSQENLNFSGKTYRTYEGLVAEEPCNLSLNLTVAHVSSTNEDYLCSEDASLGGWSWRPYQGGNGNVMGENGRVYETFVDSRDGHIYKMVTIGKQTWMAENLDFAADGSACFVNSKTGLDECGLYSRGRFYPWSIAVDSAGIYSKNGKGCGSSVGKYVTYGEDCTPIYPMRGICPQGWHLPDTSEWRTLFDYTNGDVLIKDKDNPNAADAFGFSALHLWPILGDEITEGSAAIFWTSTIIWGNKHTEGLHEAEIFDSFQQLNTYGGTFDDRRRLPVRCIQDEKPSRTSQEESNRSSSSYAVETLSLDKNSSIKVTPLADGYGDYNLSYSGVVKSDDNHKIDSLGFNMCSKKNGSCAVFPVSFKTSASLGAQSINLASTMEETFFNQDEFGCGDFFLRAIVYMSSKENSERTIYVDSLESAFSIQCNYVGQSSNSTCTEMEMVENVSLSSKGQKALNFATGLSSNPDVTLNIEYGYPYFVASSGVKIIQEGSHEPGYIPLGSMCFESFTEVPNGEANPMELELYGWYLVKSSSGTYPFMVASRITDGITITYFKKK